MSAEPQQTWPELVVTDQFDNDILPFWEALKKHEFCLWRCARCGKHYWPMALCRDCDDATFDDMKLEPTSGLGNVFSWCVVHRVNNPLWEAEVPYALVLVELDEGPIFPTRLSGHAPKDIHVGMRVAVDFVDVPQTGLTLPLFRLAD